MHPQYPRMHDGSDVFLNGLTYRIAILGRKETGFLVPQKLSDGRVVTKEDSRGFNEVLEILEELAQKCNELNERLLDCCDGITSRALGALLQLPEVSQSFKQKLVPYVFSLLKHGSNVVTERACVMIPPAPRSHFEREIGNLSSSARDSFPWREVLDNLFEAVPLATQGFFLFETAGDRQRFEQSLGADYATTCNQLRELFAKAVTDSSTLKPEDWDNLDRWSQKAVDLQKARIEAALEQGPEACRAVATRVRMKCDASGRLVLRATHYSEEFALELEECRALLLKAYDATPPYAIELRGVLSAQAAWCVDRSGHESWAESLPRWVGADNADNLIDVNLTFEEKVSRLGSKGGLQLLVCAFDPVPDNLAEVYATVREQARKQNLHIVFLRQLLVGGGASNYTLAGEKLPDPAGRPAYKVMIFTNTTRTAMVLCNAPLIVSATEWPAEDLERLADSAKLSVLFHEYGHTMGDYNEYLGDLGGSVEETNAEASAIYQTARLAPEHLEPVGVLEACWTPVRRALQGPTESHSHANIVLFHELHQAGAVEVVTQASGRKLVRLLDLPCAVRVAWGIAQQMRFWECGLPRNRQQTLSEEFAPTDRGQDERVAKAARALVESLSATERAELRQQVLEEVRAWFAIERLHEIARPLREVIATMPAFQAVSIVPTDRRFGWVLDL